MEGWFHPGQRCLLPLWLCVVLATVLSDTAKIRSSPPRPPPSPPAPVVRLPTIDPPPWHLLEPPPPRHINQGVSGSGADRENRQTAAADDASAAKGDFNTVRWDPIIGLE